MKIVCYDYGAMSKRSIYNLVVELLKQEYPITPQLEKIVEEYVNECFIPEKGIETLSQEVYQKVKNKIKKEK